VEILQPFVREPAKWGKVLVTIGLVSPAREQHGHRPSKLTSVVSRVDQTREILQLQKI
jgi:hypothetical protein